MGTNPRCSRCNRQKSQRSRNRSCKPPRSGCRCWPNAPLPCASSVHSDRPQRYPRAQLRLPPQRSAPGRQWPNWARALAASGRLFLAIVVAVTAFAVTAGVGLCYCCHRLRCHLLVSASVAAAVEASVCTNHRHGDPATARPIHVGTWRCDSASCRPALPKSLQLATTPYRQPPCRLQVGRTYPTGCRDNHRTRGTMSSRECESSRPQCRTNRKRSTQWIPLLSMPFPALQKRGKDRKVMREHGDWSQR